MLGAKPQNAWSFSSFVSFGQGNSITTLQRGRGQTLNLEVVF